MRSQPARRGESARPGGPQARRGGLGRLIARTFFREVVIQGRDTVPPCGPVIFAPNHPNALVDPLLLQFLSPPHRLRFVAKEPLFRIPLLGWLLRRMRAIPVLRRMDVAGEVDYTLFFAACVDALGAGESLVIFPEGRSLPQPHLAPLRTGAARLFFQARDRGIPVQLVPVGLNYERGTTFRTSVLVSLGAPLETARFETGYAADPRAAVEAVTTALGEALDHLVFQTQTHRDRELLLLLERLSTDEADKGSWPHRLSRLKRFEQALEFLQRRRPAEIEHVRHLLSRYERLAAALGVREEKPARPAGGGEETAATRAAKWALAAGGLVLAAVGAVLNWVPYRLSGILARRTQPDDAGAATYKIVYALFLFPLTYVAEGWLLERWWGWPAALLWAAAIVPWSYFTLWYFEWLEGKPGLRRLRFPWPRRGRPLRALRRLVRLRQRILSEVEALADHWQSAKAASS